MSQGIEGRASRAGVESGAEKSRLIYISPPIAQALGKGLQTYLAYDLTETAMGIAQVLTTGETHDDLQTGKYLLLLQQGFGAFTGIFDQLIQRHTVGVKESKSGSRTLTFSKRTRKPMVLPPEIVIDENSNPDLFNRLTIALTHDLINAISPQYGYATILQRSKDKRLAESGKKIYDASSRMAEKIHSLRQAERIVAKTTPENITVLEIQFLNEEKKVSG